MVLIVVSVDTVEGSVDDGLDAIEGIEDALGAVKVFPSRFGVGEAELDASNLDDGVDEGVL